MSEYRYHPEETEEKKDHTDALKKLIEMHGSLESALFNIKHQLPAMQKELTELQDRDLALMNKSDLDRMMHLERVVPDFTELMHLLETAVNAKNQIPKDIESEVQDLGDTIH